MAVGVALWFCLSPVAARGSSGSHGVGQGQDDPGCRSCVARAAALFASGVVLDAATLLRDWQERCPHSSQLHLLLSTVLLRLGGHEDEALRAAAAAAEIAPDSVAAHLQCGLLLMAADNNLRARSELERTAELDPGNYEAWSALSTVCFRLHDEARASECANKAADLEPSTKSARLHMLKNLQHAGKLSEARQELKKLLSAGGSSPELMEELAQEAVSIGAWDEAVQAGLKVCAAYPRAAAPLKLTALAQLNNHSYENCLRTCERLLSFDPQSAYAQALKGRAHLKLGAPAEGEQEIKSALARTPELPMGHLAAGELEFSRGNYAPAKAELMQALDSDPSLADTAELAYLVGEVLEKNGNREESIAYFRKGLSRGLTGAQADAAKQAIERLK